MGKRKRHNLKAREQLDVTVDTSSEKKIHLDASCDLHQCDSQTETGDDTNALILPSKKRKTQKTEAATVAPKKPLSKKERKKLEKKVELSQKKAQRSELLVELQKYQATQKQLAVLTSISAVHSQKFQRKMPTSGGNATNEGFTGIRKWKFGNKKKHGNRKKPDDKKSDDSDDDSDDDAESESESSSVSSNLSSDEEMESEEDEVTETEEVAVRESGKNGHGVQEMAASSGSQSETKSASASKPEDAASSKPLKGSTAGDAAEKTSSKNAEVKDNKPVVNIVVNRKEKLQKARLKLPILGMEQEVVEAIHENPTVIIVGDTGSGKTTQVPQFLYEAGYAHGKGIIGVTEPRRVAAISMSKRVAEELNVSNRMVSYQIRSEGNVTPDTKIKFMTDGVLLREVQRDFTLTKYSSIIIDEAHERSVFTDILIGLLSKIVRIRHKRGNPLKLIIMSATLRIEDFTENPRLFRTKPPVIKVDGRQFDVELHWQRKTLPDYLGAAYRKVCQVHNDLPDGGILVFVTGQQEIHTLCQKLRKTFPYTPGAVQAPKEADTPRRRRRKKGKSRERDAEEELPDIDLDSYSVEPAKEEEEEEEEVEAPMDFELPEDAWDGEEEGDGEFDFTLPMDVDRSKPLYVLPLYSLLAADRQAKVFEPPPEGCRLCVVATNIAETSLTIPNIRYVVDTGKTKTRLFDKVTGVSTFHVTWTSKASANQRLGRAGRVGPGKCFRLYSSAVFNDDFEEFSPPEMLRRPVDDIVLQMKSMKIVNILNFSFPTPPDVEQVKAAERLLISLGALKSPEKKEDSPKMTSLGLLMSRFHVAPRYSKMLALSNQHGMLPYVVALVSALSVEELFVESCGSSGTEEEKEAQKLFLQRIKKQKREFAGLDHGRLLGDLMVMLRALLTVETEGSILKSCQRYNLRYKAINEIRKLRTQLTNAVNALQPDLDLCIDPKLQPPTQDQARLLRQIVLAGLGDHVARRWPDAPLEEKDAKKRKHAYQCMELADPVYIHPSSVLSHQNIEYIVYQQVTESEGGTLYMRGVAGIEPEWLPVIAPGHCILSPLPSPPHEDPPPSYNAQKDAVVCQRTSTYGRAGWKLPAVELDYPHTKDKARWFACFLLEGTVEPALAQYRKFLLNTPQTMVQTWSHLQPRTTRLLQALVQHSVVSRNALHLAWTEDPQYLLREYQGWLPEALHNKVAAEWPPFKK